MTGACQQQTPWWERPHLYSARVVASQGCLTKHTLCSGWQPCRYFQNLNVLHLVFLKPRLCLWWNTLMINTLQAVHQIPTTVTLQSALFKGKTPKIVVESLVCCLFSACLRLYFSCTMRFVTRVNWSLRSEQCDFIWDFWMAESLQLPKIFRECGLKQELFLVFIYIIM